ncbi:DUF2059 domain-containing protein [Gallaecimonas pentaromativorans]|uniref:DUF2059 domain-containing protein n=1 Tax=Gallaecimonas pentaromativorans TaxID=584787 RepID=UPI003A8CF6D7
MKKLLCVLLVALSVNAYADNNDKTRHDKVVELIQLMNMDSLMDSMYAQMDNMMKGMSAKLDIKPSEQAIFDKYHKRMLDAAKETMGWKVMEPNIITIYERNFTDQQLNDMLAFYRSDTGKAVIAKMPQMMQESMGFMQQAAQNTMGKFQQIAQEMQAELSAHRQAEVSGQGGQH